MSDFLSFTELLPRAIARYHLQRETRAALVCKKFRDLLPSIVGADAAEVVHPKYLKNGVLVVGVPTSVWAQRVYVHRHELLTKLRIQMNDADGVSDLRTVLEADGSVEF
jgi:hypothetical protein